MLFSRIVTSTYCGSIRNAGNGVEVPDVKVYEGYNNSAASNEDLKRLTEE